MVSAVKKSLNEPLAFMERDYKVRVDDKMKVHLVEMKFSSIIH